MRKYRIPGMEKSGTEKGFLLRSDSTGMQVEVTFAPKGDLLFRLVSPEFPGEEATEFKTDDWNALKKAYAEHWLRWASVTIGGGFHPDTPADHYEPPLPEPLRSEYDAMLELGFQYLSDPYAIGIDAWEKAGIFDGPKP